MEISCSYLYLHCRVSCPENTFPNKYFLETSKVSPTAWASHVDNIWCLPRSFLLLWLLLVDAQCQGHHSEHTYPQWQHVHQELLLPNAHKAALSAGAQGVLTSEKWRNDPGPRECGIWCCRALLGVFFWLLFVCCLLEALK